MQTRFKLEKDFQSEIFQNAQIKQDICECLKIDYKAAKFIKEDKYINGLTADFSILENGVVMAILECKGGEISVTDFVRGIGQIFQYEFFAENKLSSKNYSFCEMSEFSSVYIFPDSVLRLNDFNVGLFKYPESKKIIEINSNSLAVRLISDEELKRLRSESYTNRKIISQYYIHDSRIFELYFLLRILSIYKLKSKKIDRKELEYKYAKKLATPNASGWRNMFISLSTLGFIAKNTPTNAAQSLVSDSYASFAYCLFSYFAPFFEIILNTLLKANLSFENELEISNVELFDLIYKDYGEIAFLSEIETKSGKKNTRYISSFLNIMRDDYAIFDFEKKKSVRKLLFNPFKSSKNAFIEHIEKHSKYNKYKENFKKVLDEI